MAHSLLKHFFLTGALCAGSALVLSSCIDDSYDLDKVDLTGSADISGWYDGKKRFAHIMHIE